MGRLDELDPSVSLNRRDEARRLEAAQQRLLELRLILGGKRPERPFATFSGVRGHAVVPIVRRRGRELIASARPSAGRRLSGDRGRRRQSVADGAIVW
jgi:hypothetical protein